MRLFSFITKLFLFFGLIASVAVITVLIFISQDYPIVEENRKLTSNDIKQAKSFLNKNNPSLFKAGERKTTVISEGNINLLARYALNKTNANVRVKTKLFNSSLYLINSIYLPQNPFGDYINSSSEIHYKDGLVTIESLEVGDISVPKFISELILKKLHKTILYKYPEFRLAKKSLTNLSLTKKQMSISYVWQPEIINQFKNTIASSLISKELRNRIFIYTQQLQVLAPSINEPNPSLSRLLRPMFAYAVQRSKTNNPIEENRALFIVLGAYMVDKDIAKILNNRLIGKPQQKTFYVYNREDLSQHLLVSAALTSLSDSSFAKMVGFEKEIKDSDGGSGFSFSDLAADRAGVTLANIALSTESRAHIMQKRLSRIMNESDYMPNINGLPDNLRDIDFKIKYQNTNSKAYKNIIRVIDKRISSCTVYR